ncbi:MAG TPA: maleylpyruvate isomerase N-terminal domain-containing protein [Dehalococcoidia bacterium]|jgi:hypothetical protein|nr:maleylpyruvate isomerase N-terminal domain-containing protein [Dehalococcoidia bacterium]
MTNRSEEFAARFEEANNEFIALIERLDETQWRSRCSAEGWTVAQAACHLAEDHPVLADFAQLAADGKPLPDFTVEAVDQMNAEQAGRNANATKEQVIHLLRTNGAAAAAVVRGLTDAQLDNAISVPASHPFRVLENLPERLTSPIAIEAGLIGHFREHGASILEAAFPALTAHPAGAKEPASQVPA